MSAGVRAVAARGPDGGGAILVARYTEDNNDTATRRIALRADGVDFSRARCHVTDAVRTYTEVPLEFDAAGAASLRLQPNSFALVEWWGDGSLKSTSLENYRYAPGASAVSSHDGKALSREETSMVLHAPCAGGQACVAAEEVGKMLCVAEPALPRDLAKREVGAAQTGEGRTPARPYSAAADRNRGRMDLRSDSNFFLARHRS